jgi:hypothetical protein
MQKGNSRNTHPPTHKKRLAKILYHSGIRIAGAAGASKDQSLRKELTLEADFSSSSTACWAGIGEEGDEGEATPDNCNRSLLPLVIILAMYYW